MQIEINRLQVTSRAKPEDPKGCGRVFGMSADQ